MLTPLIDDYLAIRRAAGFSLRTLEGQLRHYERFAKERGDTHVRATPIAKPGCPLCQA